MAECKGCGRTDEALYPQHGNLCGTCAYEQKVRKELTRPEPKQRNWLDKASDFVGPFLETPSHRGYRSLDCDLISLGLKSLALVAVGVYAVAKPLVEIVQATAKKKDS